MSEQTNQPGEDGGGRKLPPQVEDKGFFREFVEYARQNRKFFLIPIVIILALIGVLVFVASSYNIFIYPI